MASRGRQPALAPVALPPCPRPDLLLGVLLARLSDPRSGGRARHSSSRRVSPRGTCGARTGASALVCADAALDRRRRPGARDRRRRRDPLLAASDCERLASPNGCAVHGALPLVYRGAAGLLLVSVGRHASRGRVPLVLVRAERALARARRGGSAVAFQPVHAPMGVVPDLLRV